uniref:Secreted protein n=1 Tax=Spermophilus dauricus TaxID=99837 RepID=A0A8C9QUF3_SPEDA
MMVLFWQPLKMWWWSLSSTAWVFWASWGDTEDQHATGATWTKKLPYSGPSRISPTLEASLIRSPFLASLQVALVCSHMWCLQCPKNSSMVPLHLI